MSALMSPCSCMSGSPPGHSDEPWRARSGRTSASAVGGGISAAGLQGRVVVCVPLMYYLCAVLNVCVSTCVGSSQAPTPSGWRFTASRSRW
jgi:hypothetical protein